MFADLGPAFALNIRSMQSCFPYWSSSFFLVLFIFSGCSIPSTMPAGYLYSGSGCSPGTIAGSCTGISCDTGYKQDPSNVLAASCASSGSDFTFVGCIQGIMCDFMCVILFHHVASIFFSFFFATDSVITILKLLSLSGIFLTSSVSCANGASGNSQWICTKGVLKSSPGTVYCSTGTCSDSICCDGICFTLIQ